MRAHQRRVRPIQSGEARLAWKQEVARGGCAMCRAYPVDDQIRRDYSLELRDIQGHHVIEQQHLKRRHLHDHLWDPRNGMGLCGYHHPRHTNWRQRVPRELLPPAVYDFAKELNLEWLLDQYLPA